MNDHNQKLEPTSFALGGQADADAKGNTATEESGKQLKPSAQNDSQRWVLIGAGSLLLLGLLVFFWLPSLVSEPEVQLSKPTETAQRKTVGPQISPWSDAQLQKQRKEAQDVLALLLDEQFTLEEMGVEQWAKEEYLAAQALATLGDELYREQDFQTATETYQQGLEAFLSIAASVPAIFEQHLQQGLAALETGAPDVALAQLTLAQLINPDSREVNHALQRAQNLAPVMALLKEAAAAVTANNLDLAVRLLQEASALDPEHNMVAAQLNQVRRDISRRDFNQAMTAGYDALDRKDFDVAEQQFKNARRIMPSAQETESAIAQARTGRTRARIDSLADKARAAEQSENWDIAVKDYEAILNIDETVVFARSGMIRGKTRADLDQRLQQIISQPGRLQDQSIYNRAQQTWREAASLSQAGPKLKRQLDQVREQLALASTPIAVLLQSDELTDVTVYRVAKLGTFRRQQLELKPGTYTAVGVRSGYRDVRRKFSIAHGKNNPVIDISCTEPI
jgi:hypothetical protein